MSSTYVCLVVCLAFCNVWNLSESKRAERGAASHGVPSFAAFISTRGRAYRKGSLEYEQRRALYEARAARALLHNGQASRRWTAGINNLWDSTETELAAMRGWNGGASLQDRSDVAAAQPPVYLTQHHSGDALPSAVSWESLHASKMSIDQGSCGSCWAVATVVVLQAHNEIYNPGHPRSFSAQELVSCVPNPKQCGGEGGCRGATVELALEYAKQHGMATQKEVPYHASDEKCKSGSSLVSVNSTKLTVLRQGRDSLQPAANLDVVGGMSFGMNAWEKLPENKYEPLRRALVERGPVGVSVGATGWQSYSHGVFDSCDKNVVINHAVTLIGYGVEKDGGDKWWRIKNSWGLEWGEKGNIRLLRRDDDETASCGIDDQPEKGTACIGGPKQVTVCGMCGILYDTAVPHFVGEGGVAKGQSLLSA